MPSITIRNIDKATKSRLRVRAAMNDRSMEEEARDILRSVLNAEPAVTNLAKRILARFHDLHADLELPSREPMRSPPDFD